MKKSKKVVLVTFIIVICLFAAGKIILGNMVRKVQNISVSMPDLSNVRDGSYIGEYSIAPVRVKVEVSVSGRRITQIIILQHDNGLGGAAERMIDDVVEEQSLDIDAVSGATVSSKCILKAIENAIQNGIENEKEKGDLSE